MVWKLIKYTLQYYFASIWIFLNNHSVPPKYEINLATETQVHNQFKIKLIHSLNMSSAFVLMQYTMQIWKTRKICIRIPNA